MEWKFTCKPWNTMSDIKTISIINTFLSYNWHMALHVAELLCELTSIDISSNHPTKVIHINVNVDIVDIIDKFLMISSIR